MGELEFNPLAWTRVLVGIALALQSVELLLMRAAWSDDGVWSWPILRRDFDATSSATSAATSRWVRAIVETTLPASRFFVLLWVRLVGALVVIIHDDGYLLALLFFSSLLISIRWRGAFNGGSDYMTNIVLFGLTLGALFPNYPLVALGGIYYIALQSCCSYTISGLVKLRSSNWRRGAALHAFISSGVYAPSQPLLSILCRPLVAIPASWGIIAFECLFPIALLDRTVCVVVLCVGALFHLANSYILGLNRFLFIWLATYPAVFWCSGSW